LWQKKERKEMKDLRERVASVRDDREHGSRWLVRQTIQLLYELATEDGVAPEERLQRARQAGRELAQARPAMAALAGAVRRILATSGGPDEIARTASRLLQEYDRAIAHISEFARPHLRDTIMTHSLSGTVLEVLKTCAHSFEQLIILEGRPLYEGRTVARSLADQSLKLTVITDAQADIFLPMCRAVVVGADSVLADGGVLNKAGTALLARAARSHGVPFYVLSESLKISPRPWSGDLALLEEHPGQEVWHDAPPQVAVRNFYFDRTPAELISGIITEQGPLDAAAIRQQAEQLREVTGPI
jgi:translation initiation factor 2B subunit (eIF-2B alpha/beta/delta family)